MTEPSAAEELMLLCVSGAATRSAGTGRARELAARADWDELLRLLARQRLVPLVAARLPELTLTDPPPGFAAAAAEVTAAARRAAVHNELATERAIALLDEAGIRALPLKGAPLARALYGDGAMRVSQDVDLLVEADRLRDAAEALSAIGFAHDGPPPAPGSRPPLHLRLVHGALPDVELHWRVHWYEERFSAELLAGAGLAHDYAALLLFWARDGFAGLRLAADIAQWWDLHGTSLGPDELEGLVARHPQLRRPLGAAAFAAHRLVRVPSPLAPGRRPPVAVRLGNWRLTGDDNQIRANTTLVDLLLSPRGRRREFVRRHVLLPDRVLAERGAAPGALGRARTLHVMRLAARYLIAGWRIRGGREWSPPPRRSVPTTPRRPRARG